MNRWALGTGLGALALASTVVLTTPHRARACGGCFGPTGTATVVTAHRMAMSMSPTQSTLWDQFAYSGDASEFVWVLPSSPEARVEVADNRFFEQLESSTNVQLQGTFPPLRTFCPDPCGGFGASPSDGAARDAGAAPPGAPPPPPVMVHHEGTVGPYETATVSSDDPMALLGWLQERGYAVPDAMLPTIRYYGEMGLAFVALRLSPGEGIQRMQPVRVTVPGLMYTLPLRMVAAGVADKVGLRLFVIADSRYEAQNFPNATIDANSVYYDWATSSFNYDALFTDALNSNSGRTWVTTYVQSAPPLGGRYWGEDGMFDIDDDLSVALEGLSTPTLTRMEASLGVDALDRDLILSASPDDTYISNFISVFNERNRPPEPECSFDTSRCGGPFPPTPGTVGPGGSTSTMPMTRPDSPRSRGGSTLCSATAGSDASSTAPLLAVALAALAFAMRRRSR
ncbi:MAG: DUF2330 domain-containing protein [Deltaproteobacteria bacterium]|nr:DUF2330 domain-containing protein [Deltaproteobacteria bacterium]